MTRAGRGTSPARRHRQPTTYARRPPTPARNPPRKPTPGRRRRRSAALPELENTAVPAGEAGRFGFGGGGEVGVGHDSVVVRGIRRVVEHCGSVSAYGKG